MQRCQYITICNLRQEEKKENSELFGITMPEHPSEGGKGHHLGKSFSNWGP